MIQIKTVTTTATETEITFEKFNLHGAKDLIYIWVRNLGDNDVYMSDVSGITAEADDVILLSAGSIGLVTSALDHKIYVLGASKLECHAQLFAECPFRGVGSGGGGSSFIGKTTTVLTDGSTTNPIIVNGKSVTAKNGDIALYDKQEFIFDGTYWNAFGDMSGLGNLAYKNSASGSFTPAGSVAVTETTDTVTGMASAGTLPTWTYNAETMNLTYNAGTLPTADTTKSVVTGATAAFIGTAGTVDVS